ncbi:hypothetical protein PAMP_003498 [Pampus punctatissimus]
MAGASGRCMQEKERGQSSSGGCTDDTRITGSTPGTGIVCTFSQLTGCCDLEHQEQISSDVVIYKSHHC